MGNIKQFQDHEHTISEKKQGGDGHGEALLDTIKMKSTRPYIMTDKPSMVIDAPTFEVTTGW